MKTNDYIYNIKINFNFTNTNAFNLKMINEMTSDEIHPLP